MSWVAVLVWLLSWFFAAGIVYADEMAGLWDRRNRYTKLSARYPTERDIHGAAVFSVLFTIVPLMGVLLGLVVTSFAYDGWQMPFTPFRSSYKPQ